MPFSDLLVANEETPPRIATDLAALQSLAITAQPRLQLIRGWLLLGYAASPVYGAPPFRPSLASLIDDRRLMSRGRSVANPFPQDKFYPPQASAARRGLAARVAGGANAMLTALFNYAIGG